MGAPHEYPTQKTAMREATLSTPDSPLVPLLAVLCTAVVRRVFHASIRMVRQLSFGLFHFHSSVFENVCTVKKYTFLAFSLRVWKKSCTFVAVLQNRKFLSIKYTS